MNKIKLLIDTATDLPDEIIDKYNIGLVQLNVAFGDEDFTGKSKKEFYDKMRVYLGLPKTSAPSPERFIEQYKGPEDVLMLCLSHKLSATYSTAELAKELYFTENPPKNITVVDTGNGCIGSGLLAIIAGEMIEAGHTIEEVANKIISLREDVIHYGILETLDNAVKGGRVSKTKGMIANALNLKPIVEISDYVVKAADKAKGTKNGLKKIVDLMVSKMDATDHKYTKLGIAHANAIEKAMLFKEEMLSKKSFDQVIITEVGPLMGTYAAEGAILVAVV